MSLVDHLKDILKNDLISFEQFMQLALYHPMYGYYTTKQNIFGSKGDFTTAPEVSPLFPKTIASQIAQYIAAPQPWSILEFGAGSGKMAANILRHLKSINQLPEKYYIIEISPALKQLQQQTIQKICPELLDIVIWKNQLPESNFNGVILANEVLDAMPINRYHVGESIFEYYIELINNELSLKKIPINDVKTISYIKQLVATYQIPKEYDLEINFYLQQWLADINKILSSGIILIIDYGFAAKEFYHPDRRGGTLMCHYQHSTNQLPLQNIGMQDISAHVNFTQVAELAAHSGIDVLGYTNQASFLINAGILNFIDQQESVTQLEHNQQIKLLTLPSEMGDLFKVMALSKNTNATMSGFQSNSQLHKL